MRKLKILKFEKDEFEIRSLINKITIIRDYSKSKNEKKLLRFYYMLSFLRTIIFERINLCFIMKKIIMKKIITYTLNDKKRISKFVVEFE